MFTTRSTYRPAALCVVACALLVAAAPAAAEQPPDMHASVALAAAKSHQQQDLRSPDASDPAVSARKQDLRHLQAGGSYTPGSTPAVSGQTRATAVDPAPRTLPGPPTWPVNPQPIKPAPVGQVSGSGSLDWTLIGLGIAGSLLLVGGIAGVARPSRRTARARLAA